MLLHRVPASLAVTLLAVAAGCAPFTPGQGVRPDFAQRWGCDYDRVMEDAAELKQGLESGQQWIPQVGWSACRLLAANGRPTSVDLQQSSGGRGASWWYQSDSDTHLVSLEARPSISRGTIWVVTYVGW